MRFPEMFCVVSWGPFDLTGKNAVVTGGAMGIGFGITKRLAEAGANVLIADIDLQTAQSRAATLAGGSGKVAAVQANVTDDDAGERIVAKCVELFGSIDIMVNNAGIYPAKSFLDVDEAFLKKVMDVNLNSVFWMCQHMIKGRLKKGGVIINMGSIEAVMPLKEELSHYDITKAGVMVLSRTLASEYAKHGFRVNVLVPGGIWTSGTKKVAKELMKLKLGVVKTGIEYDMRTPQGRIGKPDEIARMALVLASDLSTYVNGTLVVVDGGFLSS